MSSTIDRREALRRVAYLMGGALSAPAVLGVLNGCTARPDSGSAAPGGTWKPVFLTSEQGAVVAEVADIMIPRTDTPGAIDVGVPAFIDTMLNDVYAKEDQDRFVSGLTEFEAQSRREHGRAFLELEQSQRVALVQAVHDVAVAAERQASTPAVTLRRPFMLMTKELTLLGYFTSEIGATQVLQYDPIPGAFRGCLPLSQAGNGKTWAEEMSRRF